MTKQTRLYLLMSIVTIFIILWVSFLKEPTILASNHNSKTIELNPSPPSSMASNIISLWVNNFGYDASAGGWRIDKHPRIMADVNGDGKDDVVGFGNIGAFASLSSGSGFGSPQLWVSNYGYNSEAGGWRIDKHPRIMADVNGDGKGDIVGFGNVGGFVSLSSGSGFGSPQLWVSNYGYNSDAGGWRVNMHPRMMADVNGDGKDDIVGFGNVGVFVSLSSGSGFGSPQIWVSGYGYNSEAGGWRIDKHPRMMADVNGDGKDDIVGFGETGVFVSLSSGSGFGSPQLWVSNYGYNSEAGGWRIDKHPRMMADVNGDGKDDIVGFGETGVFVSLSSGSGFGSPQLWVSNYGYNSEAGGWRIDKHPRIMADVNGDGKDDIVGFGETGVFVSLSSSSGFGSPQLWVSSYGYLAGGWRVNMHPRIMADSDGDGKKDIIGFGNAGVYVSTNLSQPPEPPQPTCTFPFFSQNDPSWKNHPLRTNGVCPSYCNTIGKCGCTLTSGAMIFKYYGANLTPASLSDCMGTSACPFYWNVGATCSGGKAQYAGRPSFSWNRLEQELNQNKRPVILGMHKGNNTHWVVVLRGSGSNASNYTIHDPWPTNGAYMKLSAYNSWYFDWIALYTGQPPCDALTTQVFNPASVDAQSIVARNSRQAVQHQALTISEAQSLEASSVVTGSASLYRMTDITMTLQLLADSEAENITEMLLWSDSMTETTWQPFSSFVYLPVSDEFHVRFRDELSNTSEIESGTHFPPASPKTVSFEIFLPIIIK